MDIDRWLVSNLYYNLSVTHISKHALLPIYTTYPFLSKVDHHVLSDAVSETGSLGVAHSSLSAWIWHIKFSGQLNLGFKQMSFTTYKPDILW